MTRIGRRHILRRAIGALHVAAFHFDREHNDPLAASQLGEMAAELREYVRSQSLSGSARSVGGDPEEPGP